MRCLQIAQQLDVRVSVGGPGANDQGDRPGYRPRSPKAIAQGDRPGYRPRSPQAIAQVAPCDRPVVQPEALAPVGCTPGARLALARPQPQCRPRAPSTIPTSCTAAPIPICTPRRLPPERSRKPHLPLDTDMGATLPMHLPAMGDRAHLPNTDRPVGKDIFENPTGGKLPCCPGLTIENGPCRGDDECQFCMPLTQ